MPLWFYTSQLRRRILQICRYANAMTHVGLSINRTKRKYNQRSRSINTEYTYTQRIDNNRRDNKLFQIFLNSLLAFVSHIFLRFVRNFAPNGFRQMTSQYTSSQGARNSITTAIVSIGKCTCGIDWIGSIGQKSILIWSRVAIKYCIRNARQQLNSTEE